MTSADNRMIILLEDYFDIVNEEYKEASKEFFDRKRVWKSIYKKEGCSHYDRNYKEFCELEEIMFKRQKIGIKRAKIKSLLKYLKEGK